jgi:drug/metabolite transporter (DMT)-like permease
MAVMPPEADSDATVPSRPVLATVLAVALVAISFAAILVRLADGPPLIVALYRMVIASVVVLPLTIRSLKRTPIRGRVAWLTAAAGASLALHFATWITSLSYTSIAASVTLVATTPLWVALIAWLVLGIAPTLGVMIGVVLAVAGAAVIGFTDLIGGSRPLLGDGLALIAGIAAASYFLIGRTVMRSGVSVSAYVGSAYSVAALFLLPLPFLFGLSYVEYPSSTFLWVAMLALVPQLIGHTGLNYAAKYLNPTMVATVTLAEPIGSGALALVFFGEMPSLNTLVGAALLLLGLVFTIRASPLTLRTPDGVPGLVRDAP